MLFVSVGAAWDRQPLPRQHNNAPKPGHGNTACTIPSNGPSHSCAASVTDELTGSDAKCHRPRNRAVRLDSDPVNNTAVPVEYTGPPLRYSYEKHRLPGPGWASG